MSDAEDEERALRIDLMTINIEKMRFDMANEQKKLAWEGKKFAVSAILAAAALLAAGAAVGGYFTKQPGPPIVIQLPPAPTR